MVYILRNPAGPPLLVIDLEDGITMVVLVGFLSKDQSHEVGLGWV